MFGINALCKSILIDAPLFAYRLHGDSNFSRHPQLHNRYTFDVRKGRAAASRARTPLVDHIVDRFAREPWMAYDFFVTPQLLDILNPDPHPTAWGADLPLTRDHGRFGTTSRVLRLGPGLQQELLFYAGLRSTGIMAEWKVTCRTRAWLT